jgi:predicted Zn-dependent protease with MMP-like domain
VIRKFKSWGFPEDTDPLEICGMNVGVPITEDSLLDPALFPTQVYIFREALLAQVDYDGSPEAVDELREEIAITLLHEIGHFFGLDEEDLARLGFD